MTRIYRLTSLGKRLARSTNNPDTPNWKVVRHLDFTGVQTTEQIADGTGLSAGEVAGSLAQLRRGGVVVEMGGQSAEEVMRA
jgi:hypothetical protein